LNYHKRVIVRANCFRTLTIVPVSASQKFEHRFLRRVYEVRLSAVFFLSALCLSNFTISSNVFVAVFFRNRGSDASCERPPPRCLTLQSIAAVPPLDWRAKQQPLMSGIYFSRSFRLAITRFRSRSPGLKRLKVDRVVVEVGKITPIRLTLQVAGQAQTVEVTGTPSRRHRDPDGEPGGSG